MPVPSRDAAPDVLVIGAGLSGLAAARALRAAGRRPLVLDKSRGVGGRCATRRVDGMPFDHGAPFVHGSDPDFRAMVRSVPGPRRDGWPSRVVGDGAPCHPATFRPGGFRCAFPAGMTALAKHLADGVEIAQPVRITGLTRAGGAVAASGDAGQSFEAPDLVLALPVEQAAALLASLGPTPGLAAAHRVLGWFVTEPGLMLAAGYPLDTPEPDFDLLLPHKHPAFQQVVNDGAKRAGRDSRALVFHTHPRFAAAWLERDRTDWAAVLLDHAATLLGDWARAPTWTSTHRWRYARVPSGLGLSGPLRTVLPGGARLVLTGEAFDPDGGLEGAWRAGRRAAQLLLP